MNSKIRLFITLLLLLIPFSLAEQPTQQYNQIYLNPYYVASFNSGTNQNFNVSVNPPDGISKVLNAVLNFHAYILPSVQYNLKVNNQTCNTASYSVSTTQASAGMADVSFDCSNIINKAGNYTTTLSANKNTGATTATLDLTYMNNPIGEVRVFGTEYEIGQIAKSWLQLLDNNQKPILDAVCELEIYYPNGTHLVESALMTGDQHEGIYSYDYDTTNLYEGVYPVIAKCFYNSNETTYYPASILINKGTRVFNNTDSAFNIDANYFQYNENSPNPRNVDLEWIFPAINMSSCSRIQENFMTGINIFIYGYLDSVANDDITIYIYNWSNNQTIALPNKIPEGAGYKGVSNFIYTNNITKSGFYNNVSGLMIRTNDTSLNDTANNGFFIDQIYVACEGLSGAYWQELRGSSEIHINNETNKILQAINNIANISVSVNISFTEITTAISSLTNLTQAQYNNLTTQITNTQTQINNGYANLTTQLNQALNASGNITNQITNLNTLTLSLNTTTTQALANINALNQTINSQYNLTNNNINNIFSSLTAQINNLNTSITSQITASQNLIINYLLSINSTLTSQINNLNTSLTTQLNQLSNEISSGNNLTSQQIQSANNSINGVKALLESCCINISASLANLTINISNLQASANTILSIQQELNQTTQNIYSQVIALNTTIFQQFNLTNTLIYNTYQNLTEQISQNYNMTLLLNLSLSNLENITQTNQNWLIAIWNYLTGYITNALNQINQTTQNNSAGINWLINQSGNTNPVPTTILANATDCISTSNWVVQAIVLSQYNQIMTSPPISCNITSDLSPETPMNWSSPYFTHTEVCPAPFTWNWTISCT